MGYYSDAALALDRETAEKFRQSAQDSGNEFVEDFVEAPDKHMVDQATGAECWVWRGVKWYKGEEFPEIDFVNNFLMDAPWDGIYFVRVGEEPGDVETLGSFSINPFHIAVRTEALEVDDPAGEAVNPFEELYRKISADQGAGKARELLAQCADELLEKEDVAPAP